MFVKKRSVEDKFWEKVDKSSGLGPSGNCWEWTRCKTRKECGYGVITHNRKRILVHRFSYEIHKGSIPEGLKACHRCDNSICVNPDHIFLGTQVDNIRDMKNKGRQNKGIYHAKSKLSDGKVRFIRNLHATKTWNYSQIARMFRISPSQIRNVINKIDWKHVN